MTNEGLKIKHKRIALNSLLNELYNYLSAYEGHECFEIMKELIIETVQFLSDLDNYYYKDYIEEVKKSLKQNETECKHNA